MAGGDANVNFDMDRLNKQAEAEKRKAEKLDKSLDSLNASIAKMQQKDFMGLLRGAQKQYAQVAAAGGTARAAMMPAYSFQTYTPPAPTLPTPRLTVAQQFRLFRPGGTGGGAQGGGPAWGGMAAPPPAPIAPAGAVGGVNLNGLQTAVQTAGQVFRGASSEFSAMLRPMTLGLGTAAAGLAFFNNALHSQIGNAQTATLSRGERRNLAEQAARLSGGRISGQKLFDQINASSNPEGAAGIVSAMVSAQLNQNTPINANRLSAALGAIDRGWNPSDVKANILRPGRLRALTGGSDLGAGVSRDEGGEFTRFQRRLSFEQTATLRAQDTDIGRKSLLFDEAERRWEAENPDKALVPRTVRRLNREYVEQIRGIANDTQEEGVRARSVLKVGGSLNTGTGVGAGSTPSIAPTTNLPGPNLGSSGSPDTRGMDAHAHALNGLKTVLGRLAGALPQRPSTTAGNYQGGH